MNALFRREAKQRPRKFNGRQVLYEFDALPVARPMKYATGTARRRAAVRR
ncbi:MAG: hypothetical protein ACOY82_04540 [Pseudomonadota bacterium]